MFRAQVTQIENGFFVGLPPEKSAIIKAAQEGQQPEGKIVFCDDYLEVVECLKANWPLEAV